jgi:hypothetical protein
MSTKAIKRARHHEFGGIPCTHARIGDGFDDGDPDAIMSLKPPHRARIAAWAAGIALLASNGGAWAGETAITCTNPASGASWQIRIDYDRGTVDSNPAQVSDAKISWRDAKDGGNYTLDRKSGDLTVIVASSTGGYFIYDRCKLGNSG